MANQRVSDGTLQRLETTLLEKINSINSQVKGLNANLDILEGAWKGIGAAEFNKAQAAVNRRMSNLNQLLAQYLEAVEATRKLSGNNEDDVAQAFRGVDVVDSGVGVDGGGKPASALNQY